MTWEYKCYMPKRVTDDVEEINRLGAEGWELVAVPVLAGNTTAWLFKRPLKDD